MDMFIVVNQDGLQTNTIMKVYDNDPAVYVTHVFIGTNHNIRNSSLSKTALIYSNLFVEDTLCVLFTIRLFVPKNVTIMIVLVYLKPK